MLFNTFYIDGGETGQILYAQSGQLLSYLVRAELN